MTDSRRDLPSVGALLSGEAARPFLERAPRQVVTDAVRDAIDLARQNPSTAPRDDAGWSTAINHALEARERRSLRPTINATGVVLHTNLGRAPLPRAALDAVSTVAEGYCNLEYDVERGERGSRYSHCVTLLQELTGAADALVVNNGAAALILTLNTLADGREAIVSRGELVEIGGSFRIPDIMRKSGALLREVGTTNRTHLQDYRDAFSSETGAIVKVHRSNFTLGGFVAEATPRELAALGAERGVPLIHDLGSGLFISLEEFGLHGEPVASAAVRDGASVVTMSGDKLLGGPQAGIVLGDSSSIARMRGNPLTRALRVDKLTLAALEATLALYRDPVAAIREIPTLAMLTAGLSELRERAERIRQELGAAQIESEVLEVESSVGGGSFPAASIPSVAIALAGDAEDLEHRLRTAAPPTIGRIQNGRLLLDLRSVPRRDDRRMAAAVIAGLS